MSAPFTLAGIVRTHAARQGGRPMLTSGAATVTWADMDSRTSRVAQALRAEGVAPQDRVAIIDKNAPVYFELLFGGGKVNAVNVAVNWRLAPAEMAAIVNDAGARVLVVGEEFFGHLAQIEDRLTGVAKIVALGAHPRHEAYEAWVARHPARDPTAPVAPEDVAMQLYTSGTTGLPKGVMLTSANLAALLGNVPRSWDLDATSVNAVAMPLFHIGGSGWALAGMVQGGHSVLFREFVPAHVLRVLQQARITNALFVPAMLHLLALVPGAAEGDYTALRSVVYGASPITDDVLVRAMRTLRCRFIQVYGLTETTGAITQLDPADHDPGGPRAHLLRSAGRPYPWVRLRIVDPATGQAQAAGAVGEVWVRSVQVMKGYWNQPEETARVLAPDGWLRTGDAGYLDAEGFVYLTDRVKDMIISGGENVYPAEVENVLAAHPGVQDVAVIGVPDERWGETVKAIVVPVPGVEVTPAALIAHARARLAHYKCPTSVDFAETLPRNPSGKLLKRELREPYWRGRARRIN